MAILRNAKDGHCVRGICGPGPHPTPQAKLQSRCKIGAEPSVSWSFGFCPCALAPSCPPIYCLTDPTVVVKKIAIVAAVFVLILVLTRIANEHPPESPSGDTFWLYAQQVMLCSPTEITLVDTHQTESHFEKDASWPDCAVFHKGEVLDFHLSRGGKARYLGSEKTEWWRKTM
jgi:hypothetical protein